MADIRELEQTVAHSFLDVISFTHSGMGKNLAPNTSIARAF